MVKASVEHDMHSVVLAAVEHYYESIFDSCLCDVCVSVKALENNIGEENLVAYQQAAKDKIYGKKEREAKA